MLFSLLLSAVGLPLASDTAQSEPTLTTLPMPDVRTLPPATVSNVHCHIRPVRRLPGDPGYGQPPVLPACDHRPSAQAGAPASTDVTYHGGPVVTSAQETFVFLNCTASCWGNPVQFTNDFFSSEFVHVLDQYMEPSVLKTSGRYTGNPTALSISGSQPHTLTDSQLQTLILNAIKSQFPSGGGGGYQRMYGMFLPQGQDLCFDGGGAGNCYCPDNDSTCMGGQWSVDGGFCAYHDSFDSTDAVGQAIHVIYQAMPYQDAGGGCSTLNGPNGSKTDSQDDGFSHELSESISDPDGNAWWRNSDGSEMADICFPPEQNPIYLNGNAYEIQAEYSDAQHSCVGIFPNLVSSHVFNGLTVQTSDLWSVSLDSDILWRDSGGNLAIWLMNGGQLLTGAGISQVSTVWSVVGTRDFNGDGDADILWQDTSDDVAVWLMHGTALSSGINLGNVGTQWSVVGTGDFNADGTGDILWRNTSTGDVAVWLMSNGAFSSGVDLGVVPLAWQVVGTGDFNSDGNTDILWRNNSTGDLAIWVMHNGSFSAGADLGAVPLSWQVVGTGDFNGDGTSDILWRDSSGNLAIWLINNDQFSSGAIVAQVPIAWSVAETGDFNDDGKSDIVWRDTSGDVAIWLMNGTALSSGVGLGNVGTSWQVQNANAD